MPDHMQPCDLESGFNSGCNGVTWSDLRFRKLALASPQTINIAGGQGEAGRPVRNLLQ